MTELGLYLIDLIDRGYKVEFSKRHPYPKTMMIRVSYGQWLVDHIVAKVDISYDELLLAIIKTMAEEIEERIKKSE